VRLRLSKKELADATLLTHPRGNTILALPTDASHNALGAVLEQKEVNNNWALIPYFSKQLSKAQKNYSTYDRKLLAIYTAIKHFKYMLEGQSFTKYTDHKPIVTAFEQKSSKALPRQLGNLDFISQFTTNIEFIAGKENIIADFLTTPFYQLNWFLYSMVKIQPIFILILAHVIL